MEAAVGVIVAQVAVAGQVSTLCCSILECASRINSVQEDWFTVTDEYRSKVDMLSASISIYKDLMDDRRLLESSFMMQTLMRAESKLRDEEVKVMKFQERINDDQCCGWAWWLRAMIFSLISFPQHQLEQAITDVTNEINKIPSILKMQEEALCHVQRYDMRQPSLPTIYDNNNLYVPLMETQSKVIEAIERGRSVVLLHGGVGKGKTTLAKAILLHYRRSREEGNLFHHVHFESCGDDTVLDSPYTKMKDILQSLSPTSLNDSIEKDYLSGRGSRFISSAFRNFLRGKRILIILDDVLDPNFLHKMWQAAAQDCPQVTYLVTSQKPNLCNSFSDDSTPIAMGDTTKDEAIRILASLVGLDPKIIHDNLKDVAMEMIEATEGNLLALACLAAHFDDIPYKTHEKAWLEALDDLPNILNLPERKIVLGLGLDKSPHRSLWSAMELCLKSLETKEAKVILFLIYACHGHSVPQEILTIWYERINTSICTFSMSREELRSRELVKLGPGGLYTYLEGKDRDLEVSTCGVWSLRPLVELYIKHLANDKKGVLKKEIMSSKIVSAMDSVLGDQKFPQGSSTQHNSATALEDGDNEKAKVAIVLCALYFDHSHANRIVIDVATKARSASNLQDCSLVDGRRLAMEPIIWLLGQPKHGKWTELGLHSARKVFLTYMCERQLDSDGFLILLKFNAYPPAQLATLRAFLSIFTVEETPLPWKHAMKVPLDSKGRCFTTGQEAPSNALVPMLEILFRFLSQHDKPDLHLQAALALTVLAFGDKESIRKKTLKDDGTVAGLVKSWSQHGKGDLQEQVIGALNNLALQEGPQEGDSVKLALVNKEGVLAVLVKALVEHNNGNLQEVAARALSNLAASNNQEIKLKIGNEEGAIAGLVKCLSVNDKPALQGHAVQALSNLSVSNRRNKVVVANEPGALGGLVKLLSEHDNDIVQVNAAKVIFNLVNGKGDWDLHRVKILNEGGAIAMLVKALYAHDKSNLQHQAAGALASLACNELVRETIVNETTGVTGLVKLLSMDDKAPSQEAARALGNLTCSTDDKILAKIVFEDGALASLVECLSEHDKPGLQELAAAALWNLARTKDNTLKLKIINENGLLTALVSLSQHDNPSLQKRAKGALEALGGMGGET